MMKWLELKPLIVTYLISELVTTSLYVHVLLLLGGNTGPGSS